MCVCVCVLDPTAEKNLLFSLYQPDNIAFPCSESLGFKCDGSCSRLLLPLMVLLGWSHLCRWVSAGEPPRKPGTPPTFGLVLYGVGGLCVCAGEVLLSVCFRSSLLSGLQWDTGHEQLLPAAHGEMTWTLISQTLPAAMEIAIFSVPQHEEKIFGHNKVLLLKVFFKAKNSNFIHFICWWLQQFTV